MIGSAFLEFISNSRIANNFENVNPCYESVKVSEDTNSVGEGEHIESKQVSPLKPGTSPLVARWAPVVPGATRDMHVQMSDPNFTEKSAQAPSNMTLHRKVSELSIQD